mmetsp:Transcript_22163/g.59777  ORF Transcript_22163/g.59777 Transcript_22163/m.59777 type:complete len:444 (+) Transcript_22163:144-1475(+)
MKSFDMKALASRVRKPPKPHIGKRPMKFWLTASDLHLNLHQSHGDLTLVWKRGAKVVSTHPVKVMEKLSPVDESLSVTAAFPGQDLSLLCTIFLDSESNTYEQKLCEFILKEETYSGAARKVASTFVDLSQYASAEATRTELEVPLPADGSVGTLRLVLGARWLRNFTRGANDDTPSLISGVTDLSGAGTITDVPLGGGVTAASTAGRSTPASADRLPVLSPAALREDMAAYDAGMDTRAPDAGAAVEDEEARRARAIEDMWQEHMTSEPDPGGRVGGGVTDGGAALMAARQESEQLQEDKAALEAEVRRLQSVLAKTQGGDSARVRLAERVVELEARLMRSERERADVEERIAQAFTSVIRDLEDQIDRLQADLADARAPASGRGMAAYAVGVSKAASTAASRKASSSVTETAPGQLAHVGSSRTGSSPSGFLGKLAASAKR